MAYNSLGLQVNRGTPFANTQGEGITAVAHTYKSTVDTLAVIATPGYFPLNFNQDEFSIFIRDWLFIVDSTGASSFVNISGLSPVTLTPDLFVAPSFTVTAPIAAVDNNGIVIAGTNVSLEIADATHAGILIPMIQTLAGQKIFPNGLRVNIIEGVLAADQIFIGGNQTSIITIGGALASVFIPASLIADSIVNTVAGGSLGIHNNQDGVTIIGMDTASLITGIHTNRIDTISAGGHPLVIGASSVFPVELGSVTQPILVKGGVRWDLGGGTITSYEQLIVSSTWTGPWAVGQPGFFTLNKFENIVYLTSARVPPSAATVNAPATAVGVLPAAFRPTQNVELVAQNVDNGAYTTGSIVVATNGNLVAYGNNQQGPFAAAATAGVGDICACWSTVAP